MSTNRISFNKGDYCRIIQDHLPHECRVLDINESKANVQMIGQGDNVHAEVDSKSLLPSLGKTARTKQEEDAKLIASLKAGDFCRAIRDGKLTEAKIWEWAEDPAGKRYAVIAFVDAPDLESTVWIEELKPQWKVDDFCRAKWSVDNVVYESQIKELGVSDGQRYAVVEFLGYGNQDSQWICDLMESQGEKVRQTQIGEALGTTPEADNKTWKDRDPVRVTLNDVEYEATIKLLTEDGIAKVHLVGLGKDFDLPKSELKPSAGKEARAKQRAEAADKEKNQAKGKDAKEPIGEVVVDMFCRGVFKEDGLEYEGVVKSIASTDDGQYAVVEFVGYGNQEAIWFQDLLKSHGEKARQKQTKEALGEQVPPDNDQEPLKDSAKNGNPAWEIGMFCRGIYQADGLEYEGVIKTIESSQDGQYANVQFVGYGNEETIWLQDILESKGEAARQKQTKEALGEEAVTEAKIESNETKDMPQPEVVSQKAEEVSWKTGMFCRAIFTQDGLEYEGKIESIESSDEGQYALVKFVGYGNDETVWLKDLLESKGDEARQKQTKEASSETVVEKQVATEAKVESTEVAENKSEETWKVGMFCRAIFQEDGLEYEGTIESIDNSDGGKYALVKFIGYGNSETVWLKDLMESKGDGARKQQTKDALGETSDIGQHAPASETKVESTEVSDATKEKDWKIGMYCRAVYQEDGLEYEGIVKSVEDSETGKYAIVKFVGYGNEETAWLKDLLESKGDDVRIKQIQEATGEPAVIAQDTSSTEAKVKGLPQNESADATKETDVATEWKIGMFCSGVFSDGIEYEGIVKSVEPPNLLVKIIGYDNEKSISMKDVKDSKGEDARQKQFKEAKAKETIKETTAASTEVIPKVKDVLPAQNSTEVKTNPAENGATSWQAGMFCRGIFQADGLEYEGLIKSIDTSEDGQYAVVQFIGYDNEEAIWLQNLLESKGDQARQKQTQESKGTIAIDGQEAKKKWRIGEQCRAYYAETKEVYESIVEELSFDENNDEYAIVRIMGYGTAHCVWPKDLMETEGKEARDKQVQAALKDINSQKEEAQKLEADASGSSDRITVIDGEAPKRKWKIDDFCRVVCKFDGQEHEAQIIKQHPKDPQVFRFKVFGYDEIDVANQSEFKESLGATARHLQIESAVQKQVSTPAMDETVVKNVISSPAVTATPGPVVHSLVNGDKNNNYPSDNAVQNVGASEINWRQRFEKQSAKLEEMTKVNKVLMNTLSNLEQEIFVYGQVIGELKSVLKASLNDSPIIEPGNGLVNGHI